VFSCEGHLQRKFRERARDQDKLTGAQIWSLWPKHRRNDPNPLPGPLWSPDHYRAFLDQVLTLDPERSKNVTSWIVHHDRTIRRQFDLRDQYPGMPRGSGAVEAGIVKLGAWLGARTRAFQNVRRINITLGLMRANLGGHADPSLYSRIIRDELERTGGRPDIKWRAHHLPWAVSPDRPSPPGSLFRLADDAQATTEANRRRYWVSAQATSMAKKIAAMNDYHYLVGAPPLVLTSARTPSVSVAGKMVSDFPKYMDEWDPTNALDPYSTPAGRDVEVDWICMDAPTHRWHRSISARLVRLLGCRECKRHRGAGVEAKVGSDPAQLRASLKAIREAWGNYEELRPAAVAELPADPAWLADDEYTVLGEKGLVAATAEAWRRTA